MDTRSNRTVAGLASSIDFQGINQAALAACPGLLKQWFSQGRVIGREFEIGSLNGEAGKSLKINLDTGRWSDFANPSNSGGDLISLRAAQLEITQGSAAIEIANELGLRERAGISKKNTAAKGESTQPTAERDWQPLMPPADMDPPSPHHQTLGTPDHTYVYRTALGQTSFIVCRWDAISRRGKVIIPFSYGRLNGVEGWHWKHAGPDRPPWRLPQLLANRGKPVLIVEGEKAAEATARLVGDDYAVTCWAGGGSAAHQTDWSCLKGRRVFIWPDADAKRYGPGNAQAGQVKPFAEQPGRIAAKKVAACAQAAGAAEIGIVTPPLNRDDGWDLADAVAEGWVTESVLDWIAANLVREPAADPPPPVNSVGCAPADPVADCPFTPVGERDGIYYLLTPLGELRHIAFASMNVNGLESLTNGDMAWYYRHFGDDDGKGGVAFSVARARRWIMSACAARGLFDPRTPVRGPGVWADDEIPGKLLVHVGDGILIDGTWLPPGVRRGDVIYPAAPRIQRPADTPATVTEMQLLAHAVTRWRFVDPWGADFIIGFIGQAALGGAHWWHAHVYILAQKGSGKTWLAELVSYALGSAAHSMANNYTAASLHQALNGQSRTLILDEAEPGDARGGRIKEVIQMIRHMSSHDGAKIMRGSAGGQAQDFTLVGSALLSSILQGRLTPQDRSRITTIRLAPLDTGVEAATQAEQVVQLMREVRALAPRIWARAIDGFERFQKNCAAYRAALLARGAEPREADQLATLLGARDMLMFDDVTSEESALAYVTTHADIIGAGDNEADDPGEGRECLDHLLSSPADIHRGGDKLTVARLLMLAMEPAGVEACKQIQSIGLRLKKPLDPDHRALLVANNSVGLDRIFRDTRWENGAWKDALRYLDGAEAAPGERFDGMMQRCTQIPARHLPVDDGNEQVGATQAAE